MRSVIDIQYINREYNFSLDTNENVIIYEGLNGSIVTFVFRDQINPEVFVDNINIIKLTSNNDGISLNMIIKRSLADLKNIIKNFQIIQIDDMNIMDHEAKILHYNGEVQGIELIWSQAIIEIEGIYFAVSYAADSKTFEINHGTFINMINSIHCILLTSMT